jgi:hypothetical protein
MGLEVIIREDDELHAALGMELGEAVIQLFLGIGSKRMPRPQDHGIAWVHDR